MATNCSKCSNCSSSKPAKRSTRIGYGFVRLADSLLRPRAGNGDIFTNGDPWGGAGMLSRCSGSGTHTGTARAKRDPCRSGRTAAPGSGDLSGRHRSRPNRGATHCAGRLCGRLDLLSRHCVRAWHSWCVMLPMWPTHWPEYQNRTIGVAMANGWTPQRRARQSALIHGWRPWEKAHGPVTPEGKKASSKNAHRFTQRKGLLLGIWLAKQKKAYLSGLPFASKATIARMFEQCHCKPMDDI